MPIVRAIFLTVGLGAAAVGVATESNAFALATFVLIVGELALSWAAKR